MKLHKWLDRRLGFVTGSIVIMLGSIVPALVPAFASADALDSRSIAMTSSVADATGVSYHLEATVHNSITAQAAGVDKGGLVIQFCSNSPLIGLSCDAPSGLDVSSATVANDTGDTAGAKSSSNSSASTIEWVPTGSNVSAGDTIKITLDGITNPDNPTDGTAGDGGTFYARLTTYSDSVDFSTTDPGSYKDSGGIALAVTSNLNITAYVQESMTFCVSQTAPAKGCGGTLTNPSWTLGEETSAGSGIYVLQTNKLSTGEDYAQLSTNAAHGAIVDLHSDAVGCGGLVRKNDGTNCDIKPQDQDSSTNTIAAGQALFGLKIGPGAAATTGTGDTFGGLTKGTNYDNSNYYIDYVDGDATGVTSTYGSELFDSTDPDGTTGVPGPVANINMPFTFGVSAAAQTPAGIYSANLNLIATGTF